MPQRLYPNGQRTDYQYYDNVGDQLLAEIKHTLPGNVPLSKFDYAYTPTGQITNWLQQAGSNAPEIHLFTYDDADQLVSAAVFENGALLHSNAYAYDPAGNRLLARSDGANQTATFNALNEITALSGSPLPPERAMEWDAENRLVAVVQGAHRSEFAYDGVGRMVRIAESENGALTQDERFTWCGDQICEKRANAGALIQRLFREGQQTAAGSFFYSTDHEDSVRAMTDASGTLACQVNFEDFGSMTRTIGSESPSLGYTGHYVHSPSKLIITRFRTYDAEIGRWLSRDWAKGDGPNMFTYVQNDPVNLVDPLGLRCVRNNLSENPSADQRISTFLDDIEYSQSHPRRSSRPDDDFVFTVHPSWLSDDTEQTAEIWIRMHAPRLPEVHFPTRIRNDAPGIRG